MAGLSPSTSLLLAVYHQLSVASLQALIVVLSSDLGQRMCAKYSFEKPNDRRALDLMNCAAKAVVSDLTDITLAYGVSDEFR